MSRGVVVSIHIAAMKEAPMQSRESANAIPGMGIEGDRYCAKQGTFSAPAGADKEITLIESEAVDALNASLGSSFDPGEMRRNVVTRNVALNHLVDKEFRVGAVKLRGIRLCEPCQHLENLTRKGVRAEMIHRCGLRAQILEGGTLRRGDAVSVPGDS